MKRREFIKNISAGAAVVAVPASVIAEVKPKGDAVSVAERTVSGQRILTDNSNIDPYPIRMTGTFIGDDGKRYTSREAVQQWFTDKTKRYQDMGWS